MADKRGEKTRKPSKLSKVETRKLIEILSRKLAYHPRQTKQYSQNGKDLCDRILCLMKAAIKRYCNKDHDIVTAHDMQIAIHKRPVQETTATVLTLQIRISWIFFSPFDWEIRKRICKTVVVNSGVLFVNYACACKTAVLKDSFPSPFSVFPMER